MYQQRYLPARDPLDYIKQCLTTDYANFEGRARRSEYWFFALGNLVVSFALQMVSLVLTVLSALLGSDILIAVVSGGFAILSLGVGVGLLVPGLAVAVRRLHDTGRSGWMLLLALIPLVGVIVLVVFLCQDSHPAANAYGPNPKLAPTDDPLDHLEAHRGHR